MRRVVSAKRQGDERVAGGGSESGSSRLTGKSPAATNLGPWRRAGQGWEQTAGFLRPKRISSHLLA